MRLCSHCNNNPVFGTDKLTKLGYCKSCQYKRTDLDRRSIMIKGLEKAKKKSKGWFNPECELMNELRSGVSVMDEGENSNDETKGIDESLVNLSNDLDYVLSLYIRYKYADNKGMVKCFTCPTVLPIKEIQNGHYIKRSNRSTRFLEANLRPQCQTCNQDHNYDETPYTNALEREQQGITDQLKELSKETYKATRSELKQLLIEYRSKLEILKQKIELPK